MNPAKIHLTRRSAMKLGLIAGAGLGLNRLHAEEPGTLPLITRTIPGSGKKIPVIGLGTNQYGVTTEEELAPRREVLRQFPKLGLSVVDTAPGYGKSEEVLGKLVTELGIRDQLFYATKVTTDDDVNKGIAMLEESFRRLQTKHIELVQVHSLRGWKVLLPLLRDWKKQGRISYYGVTTSDDNQYDALTKILETEELDFVQFDYSVGNRNAEEKILPLVAEKKIGALVNMPFGGRRGPHIIARTSGKPLPDFAKEIQASSWAQILLKYVVSHPAVTATIPGTTKLKHLEDNAGAARGTLPDAGLRKRIEEAFAAL